MVEKVPFVHLRGTAAGPEPDQEKAQLAVAWPPFSVKSGSQSRLGTRPVNLLTIHSTRPFYLESDCLLELLWAGLSLRWCPPGRTRATAPEGTAQPLAVFFLAGSARKKGKEKKEK